MSFWNLTRIIEATQGAFYGSDKLKFSTLTTDSRLLQTGEFFVALKGDQFDGHDYLFKALDAGACGALVSSHPKTMPKDFPLIVVDDTLVALQAMAQYRRQHTAAKILAITGSVGKTSAKEMLKLCLTGYGETYATSGNYNNHIGLPICLCNLPETAQFAIFEMGMNHAGEIAFLSHIAKPHISLITAVEAVHLEFFESVAEIARAKAEIFEGMHQGVAVLPADNPYFHILQTAALATDNRMITFGASPPSDFYLLDAKGHYNYRNVNRHFTLGTLGAHWPKAALGILAIVAALGLPLDKAEQALSHYREPSGRGQVAKLPWKQGEITLLDDAYNASPVSMTAALATLSTLGEGRKIAILGHMLELGKSSPKLHADLAQPIADYGIDGIITIGEQMHPLVKILPATIHLAHFNVVQDAIKSVNSLVQAGDNVLCKGSHGSGVYQLVEHLKKAQN